MQLKGVGSNVKRQLQLGIFLFTVFAAVNFFCLIGEKEDLVEFLLDGSDAAWVFAPDDILYLFWHVKLLSLRSWNP